VKEDGKWGYIDETGKYVVSPKFEDDAYSPAADQFSEGVACVKQGVNKWGFIDRDGEFSIPPKFLKCNSFHNGLAWACDSVKSCGYVGKDGIFVWTGNPGT
jgi:WG containing repeat